MQGSIPLARSFFAEPGAVGDEAIGFGQASSTSRAPLWSLISPSESNMMSGRPSSSQTTWSFEFNPPLVRPMRRGTSPFLEGSPRCGGPSDVSRRS